MTLLYGHLTKVGSVLRLPVLPEELYAPRAFVDAFGNSRDKSVWRIWNDAELVAVGVVKIDDDTTVPPGYRKTSTKTDTLLNNRISRVYDVETDPDALDHLLAAKVRTLKVLRNNSVDGHLLWSPGPSKPTYAVRINETSEQRIAGASRLIERASLPSQKWNLWEVTTDSAGVTTWARKRPELTAAEFDAMGVAVGAHVNSAFAAAETLRQKIKTAYETGVYTTLDELDLSVGWPTLAPAPDIKKEV